MADDSMEISSDHGHITDDDIDIDIDFSAADGDGDNIGDEDYMVDDAPLDNGFGGDDAGDQALHVTDQVDFMLEDVAMFDETTGELKKPEEGTILDVSISMQDDSVEQPQNYPVDLTSSSISMNGASYLASGLAPDAPMSSVDQLTESFAEDRDISSNSANDTLTGNQDSVSFDPSAQAITSGQRPSAYENDDLHGGVQTGAGGEPVPSEQGQHTVTETTAQSALLAEAAVSSDANAMAVSQEAAKSPSARTSISSPKQSLDLQEERLAVEQQEIQPDDAPRSPPTSVQEDNPPRHTSHDEDGIVNEDEVNASSLATSPDVVITWKDIEYALFAKSEFDDPNTCFLFELKILHEPLNALLKSIRDVIHDDLTDDDELCVNVTDIGLEFEETSTYIHEYTVGQIIDVFHALLKNGGDFIRPLYMHVGIRTHFTKLYASCLSGAADGKNLRDVVKTIEESESPIEYSLEQEITEDQRSKAEEDDQEAHEENEENEDNIIHGNNNLASEPLPPTEYLGEHDHIIQLDVNQIHTHDPTLDNNTDLQVSEKGATDNFDGANAIPNGTAVINKTISHVEEEDDLIDYSEDEIEMPAIQTVDIPNAADLNHEDGPAKNGKEPDATDEKLEESPHQQNDSLVSQTEVEFETSGDANREDEEGEGAFENETAVEGRDYQTDEYESITQEKYLNENVDHLKAQELAIEGIATNPNQAVDADVVDAGNGLLDDELNFFEEDIDFGTNNHDRFEVKADDQTSHPNNDRGLYDASGAAEFADPADSSATVSAGEPHAEADPNEYEFQAFAETTKYEGELDEEVLDDNNPQHDVSHEVSAVESEDEIDYDDEDGKEEPSIEIQLVDVANGSSKRSLSEVDVDDATVSRDQEHKRPRS